MELLLGEELNGRKSSRFSAFTRGALLGCVGQGLVPRWLFAHTVCLASDKKLRVTQLPASYLTNKASRIRLLANLSQLEGAQLCAGPTSVACIVLGSHQVWAAVKAARRRVSFSRVIKHRTPICKIGLSEWLFPVFIYPWHDIIQP